MVLAPPPPRHRTEGQATSTKGRAAQHAAAVAVVAGQAAAESAGQAAAESAGQAAAEYAGQAAAESGGQGPESAWQAADSAGLGQESAGQAAAESGVPGQESAGQAAAESVVQESAGQAAAESGRQAVVAGQAAAEFVGQAATRVMGLARGSPETSVSELGAERQRWQVASLYTSSERCAESPPSESPESVCRPWLQSQCSVLRQKHYTLLCHFLLCDVLPKRDSLGKCWHRPLSVEQVCGIRMSLAC